MFTRFWHVLFRLVGFSAFAPFGPLTAACGLARRRRAHVKVPIGECRISKTSDLYRVLVSQYNSRFCHTSRDSSFPLPQLCPVSFVSPPSREKTLVSLLLLSLRYSNLTVAAILGPHPTLSLFLFHSVLDPSPFLQHRLICPSETRPPINPINIMAFAFGAI